jgi:methionine-rich copper-binding protein CopC
VLVGSNPTNGAQLTTGPTTVELNFNAPVQNGPNVITVIGPDGRHWERERHGARGHGVHLGRAARTGRGVHDRVSGDLR